MKNRAVMVSLTSMETGDLRISLDDAIETSVGGWDKDTVYTFKDYDSKKFEDLEFEEAELANFGYHIIARLHAYYKTGT